MRAVGYQTAHSLDGDHSLRDLELPMPEATGHDILVEVRAVSVNPVDTKVRMNRSAEGDDPVVLGWDASGVVKAVGAHVSLFAPGDEVYYAGVINRTGTNAEYHLVDERIVAKKPRSLGFAEAAALPLTAITAYEALFDRLRVADPVPGKHKTLLIIGAAGGVGSIAVQIARAMTDLTVIGTASRPESRDWVKGLGAHHVIDHSGDLAAQLSELNVDAPGFVFSTTHTDQHIPAIAAAIAPQGRFALIDDPATLDIKPFKQKAVSVHWEFMFTRPLFATADMIEQHKLLTKIADLVDDGTLRTTLQETLGPINAANIKEAHRKLESHATIGKLVLEGF